MRAARAFAAPPFPLSQPRHSRFRRPVIPAPLPRHSRESGNPDDFNQDRYPKSSANSVRRIPSPFMGEG